MKGLAKEASMHIIREYKRRRTSNSIRDSVSDDAFECSDKMNCWKRDLPYSRLQHNNCTSRNLNTTVARHFHSVQIGLNVRIMYAWIATVQYIQRLTGELTIHHSLWEHSGGRVHFHTFLTNSTNTYSVLIESYSARSAKDSNSGSDRGGIQYTGVTNTSRLTPWVEQFNAFHGALLPWRGACSEMICTVAGDQWNYHHGRSGAITRVV